MTKKTSTKKPAAGKLTIKVTASESLSYPKVYTPAAFDKALASMAADRAREGGGGYYKNWITVGDAQDSIEMRVDVDINQSEGRTIAEILRRRAAWTRSNGTRIAGHSAEVVAALYDRLAGLAGKSGGSRAATPRVKAPRAAPKRPPAAAFQVINLDDSDDDEIRAFIRKKSTPVALKEYGKIRLRARKLRLAGKIQNATADENYLDSLYRSLPSSQKW